MACFVAWRRVPKRSEVKMALSGGVHLALSGALHVGGSTATLFTSAACGPRTASSLVKARFV